MSSFKPIIIQTFNAIHNFMIEVEKAGFIDKGSISYTVKHATNSAATATGATYINGLETLVLQLQGLLLKCKNTSSGQNPSISSYHPTEAMSDDENCDDPEEIQEEKDCQGPGHRRILTPPSSIGPSQNQELSLSQQASYSYGSSQSQVVSSFNYSSHSSSTHSLSQSLTNSLPQMLTQGDLKIDYANNPISNVPVDIGSSSTGLLDLGETSPLLTISMEDSQLGIPVTKGSAVQEKCIKCGLYYSNESQYADKGAKITQTSSCPNCSSIADSVSRRHCKPDIQGVNELQNINALKANENRKHTCEKCGRVFTKWKHLSIHHTKVHGDDDIMDLNESNVEIDDGGLPLYCCKTCNTACQTQQHFNVHTCRLPNDQDAANNLSNRILITNVLKLHKMRKFICENCSLEYRTLKRISYHLPRCSPGPYRCNVCNLLAPTKKELNYHKKKSHKDEKCFSCEECGKSFQRRTSLQKHSINWHESNNAQGPHKCDACPKKFIRRIYLTNHKIRMHGLDKKFLCQVCGNKFMNQNSLNAHMEVHNEVKKFQCSFCPKKFKRKEKLKYHERIHTGERPFLCQSCGRGFVSKSKLEEHMSRHRGDRRYRCPHCTKTYAGAWDLKQHIRKIHDKHCDKVSATLVTSTNNLSSSVLAQIHIVNPLAIATATSGLKEEEGVEPIVTSLHNKPCEEVVHNMVGSGQYLAIGSVGDSISIPVMASATAAASAAAATNPSGCMLPTHIENTQMGPQQVLNVSGVNSVPLAAGDIVEATSLSGATTAVPSGVQPLQTVQAIPGIPQNQEYSVTAIPSTNAPQGYIFAQGFDMLSPSIQY